MKVILGFLYSFWAKDTNFGANSLLKRIYPGPPGKKIALYLLKFSLLRISSQEIFVPCDKITFFFFSIDISLTIKPARRQMSTGTINSMSSV
jgi:hypothetical protein